MIPELFSDRKQESVGLLPGNSSPSRTLPFPPPPEVRTLEEGTFPRLNRGTGVNEMKGGFLIISVLALLAIGLGVWNAMSPGEVPEAEARVQIGEKAPEIEGQTLDGNPLKLSDFRGKVVVVDFWFVRCGPCRDMIPHEKQIVKQYQGRPFAWLGVNTDRNRDEAVDFVRENDITWQNWSDPASRIARRYGISWVPRLFIIDGDGVLRFHDTMQRSYRDRDLEEIIDKLVREQESKRASRS